MSYRLNVSCLARKLARGSHAFLLPPGATVTAFAFLHVFNAYAQSPLGPLHAVPRRIAILYGHQPRGSEVGGWLGLVT